MANQKCECDGLFLIKEAIEFYKLPAEDRQDAERASNLLSDFYSQLNVPLARPIKRVPSEDGAKVIAELEHLKSRVSDSDSIKQLLTCGPVLTDGNMTETTKAIKEALGLLGQGKADEALESINSFIQKQSCPIKKGAQ